ncbi:MAG: hypothetical protein MUC91_01825 [Verrucomicrobia bacterium]|jgi:hypothetical protein|nr:hypothetical protein [Verrucomicrobiota bacterium]
MNTNDTTAERGFPGGLPEFLAALDGIYRCIGLEIEDARAATFADAEIFASDPSEPDVSL